MSRNKATTPPVPADAGSVQTKLDQPEHAADLTVAEVSELKERRRLIDKHTDTVKDQQIILTLLRNEYQAFLEKLMIAKGLSMQDGFSVDTEGGVVTRTHRALPMDEPEVVPEVEVITVDEPVLAGVDEG